MAELVVLGPDLVIEKHLGGAEDFLLGDGRVTQIRNGTAVLITRFGAMTIPWSGTPEENNVVSIREHLESIYLGPHATDPLVDNLGNPLVPGALYLNTTVVPSRLKVYTSTGWQTVMGVTQLNGQEGAVTLPTVAGVQLVNNTEADIPVATINGVQLVNNTDDLLLASQSDVDTLYEAVANLAVAQGAIANEPAPTVITTTAKILPFVVTTPSSAPTVMDFDATANTITFGDDITYNFISAVTLESNNSSPVTITFNLVNVATGLPIATQSLVSDLMFGRSETVPLNTLVRVGAGSVPAAPLTIRVEVLASATGYTLSQFSSVLAASGGATAILPSQATHGGKFLTTDGINASWAEIKDPTAKMFFMANS